ncbi:hypothetical protein [Microbacterium sp. NPDC090003]|uniref:hypothetical protein n=1 Tax=Microbacterium sp. NPDC090003 TaxID=3364203 RepID=UPI003819FB7F
MPRWRWLWVQGLLFLAAGVLFGLSFAFGAAGWWVGLAAFLCLAVSSTALLVGWRERRRVLAEEEPTRRRGL